MEVVNQIPELIYMKGFASMSWTLCMLETPPITYLLVFDMKDLDDMDYRELLIPHTSLSLKYSAGTRQNVSLEFFPSQSSLILICSEDE
jgi:hypothetical protein